MASGTGWGNGYEDQKFTNYDRKARAWNSYDWTSDTTKCVYTVHGHACSYAKGKSYSAALYNCTVELRYKVDDGNWVSLGTATGQIVYDTPVAEITKSFTVNRGTKAKKVLIETRLTSESSQWQAFSSQSVDTLNALTTYTVSYDANGGSGAPASQTKTSGATLKLSSVRPTWTGRTFTGWNTAANGSGTSYAAGASYSSNANLKLYAQWSLNTFTVSYDANGGTGAPASQTKTFGTPINLSTTVPTLADHSFKGWSASQTATNASYQAGGLYTTDASVLLYAVWEYAGSQYEDDEGIPTRDCAIVNVANGEVMGVSANAASRGAYLQLNDWSEWDGNLFSVKTDVDGMARIINKFGGRTIDADAGALERGETASIRLWDVDQTRIQRWVLTETGDTYEFQGRTLKTYTIGAEGHAGMLVDADGTEGTVGSVLRLSASDGLPDQRWAFFGVPRLVSGGLYELRSLDDTSRCAQIQSDSAAAGARLVLGDADGSAGDKFWLDRNDNGRWTAICAESGLALRLDSAYVEGTTTYGVSQYPAVSSTAAQEWAVTDVGSAEIDGVTCAVVEIGSYGGSSSATSYVMDSSRAGETSDSRIVVTDRDDSATQKWVLYPTSLSSDAIPTPANVAGTAQVGTYPAYDRLPMAPVFYPCWDCTDGWTTPRPNHFEVRTSFMTLGPDGSWSYNIADSGWYTAAVHRDGTRAWLADGVALPEGYAENWLVSCNVQVRCVSQTESADGTQRNVVGPVSAGGVALYRVPEFSFTVAGLSPEGMRLGYQSDYNIGRLTVTIRSIVDDDTGDSHLTGGPLQFTSVDESGSVLVPFTRVSTLAAGKDVTVSYTFGSDQTRVETGVRTWQTTTMYNSGWDEDWDQLYARPELSYDYASRTITARMQHVGTERLWLGNGRRTVELVGKTDGQWTTFSAATSLAGDQFIQTTCYDPTQDKWGTYYEFIGSGTYFSRLYPPAHVWTWGDGDESSFVIEASRDPLATVRTFEPTYEEHIVNKRKRSVITFGHTTRSEFEATGILCEGVTTSSVEALVALVDAKHARYTAPSGEEADVAIVGATYTTHNGYTDVEVQMIEESV